MYLNYVTDPKISRNFNRSIIGGQSELLASRRSQSHLEGSFEPTKRSFSAVCPPQPKKIDSPGGRDGSNMEGPSKAEAFVVRSSTSTYPLGGATSLLPGPVNLGSMAI
ncbi:hypothetical protein V1478_012093 [Vespula squamosa]|uniref:Uncharacterized protein n=1 Tax=Vespula squamosa TaxID=30214 RepID=A0ABD2AC71_VESSQ